METIGGTISRVRNIVKAVKEDAFLTDRHIYSIILKYAKLYIKRQDNENKIMKFHSLFEALPCVDLIEIDKVEACCAGIKSNCTIMRTKDRLPLLFEGTFGPLFRTISSIDSSIKVFKTYPSIYVSMANTTTFKYNKNKYYWFLDGYLYFPNLVWDAVRIEGLWEDSIEHFKCNGDPCKSKLDDPTHIPDYLFAEIESAVLKDLGLQVNIPTSIEDDKENPLRS